MEWRQASLQDTVLFARESLSSKNQQTIVLFFESPRTTRALPKLFPYHFRVEIAYELKGERNHHHLSRAKSRVRTSSHALFHRGPSLSPLADEDSWRLRVDFEKEESCSVPLSCSQKPFGWSPAATPFLDHSRYLALWTVWKRCHYFRSISLQICAAPRKIL